jgi:hypothetical protein
MNEHPLKHNKESGLWIGFQTKKPLNYAGLNKILKQTARRLGFHERIHPHLFRHSRATELAKSLSESQLKAYLGWTSGSQMAGVYVHLSGKETDDAILNLYGLKETKKQENVLKPKKCVCGHENEPTGIVCMKCQKPLDLKTALEMEEKTKLNYELKIRELEEKMKLFEEFIKNKK